MSAGPSHSTSTQLLDVLRAHGLPPWQALLGVFMTLLLLHFSYNVLLHPLARVPGPWQARTGLGSWLLARALAKDFTWRAQELQAKYGDVVRVGRNQVLVNDARCVQQIYRFGSAASKDGPLRKGDHYKVFRGQVAPSNFMCEVDPENFARLKRAAGYPWTPDAMRKYEHHIDETVVRLRELMQGVADSKTPIDLVRWMSLFALDSIQAIAFGSSINAQNPEGADPDGMIAAGHEFNELMAVLGSVPAIGVPLLNNLLRLPNAAVGKLVAFATAAIERKLEQRNAVTDRKTGDIQCDSVEQQDCMMDAWIGSLDPVTGRKANMHRLINHGGIVVGAGVETTAITFCATLYYLTRHQDALAKVRAELQSATDAHELDEPVPTSKQGQKLKYLQAAVTETLRLNPPNPWPQPRVVSSSGLHIANTFLAPGTLVSMAPVIVNADERIFGKNAREYRPERWLTDDKEQLKRMEAAMLTFGAGNRMCLGRNIAMAELHKTLPVILRNFDFNLVPRSSTEQNLHKFAAGREVHGQPQADSWHLQSTFISTPNDLIVKVARRSA